MNGAVFGLVTHFPFLLQKIPITWTLQVIYKAISWMVFHLSMLLYAKEARWKVY